jgi:hypothetical protein
VRIQTDKPIPLEGIEEELELVIVARPEKSPEIHKVDGRPAPDRHLVLGMVQAAAMAIEERDRELVANMEGLDVRLMKQGLSEPLDADLVIVRSEAGRIGVLALGDDVYVRRVSRELLRYFTKMIRLDIP